MSSSTQPPQLELACAKPEDKETPLMMDARVAALQKELLDNELRLSSANALVAELKQQVASEASVAAGLAAHVQELKKHQDKLQEMGKLMTALEASYAVLPKCH
jgi:hypothetical protein